MRSEWILVVEDDAQIRNFITYTLKQEGFPCLTAGNAQGALSQLVSNQIDLMLLDLGLPDFDGMEVIKKVREWSEVPIIVVSARDQDNEKAAALDGGADDYLTKPFSATELITLLTGMAVAFVVSVLSIRWLMAYVRRHDFKVFGWYRIALGCVVIVYTLLK